MASFDVIVRRLDAVEPHPQADRLELAAIGGYRSVVARGQFRAGDLVAYLPEASVLPAALIEALGLTGKLAGPQQDRVHAVRLRGALSQGVVVPARVGWTEGQSVMAELGVRKFEPDIPQDLLGRVYALERDEGLSFDLEDLKMHPAAFAPGEAVVLTEKVHGVFLAVGACPADQARHGSGHRLGRAWVSSKGLLASRLAFDHRSTDAPNVYLRTAAKHRLYAAATALADRTDQTVFVLGEAFGMGVQDLAYGQAPTAPGFRAFAVVVGGRFLSDVALEATLAELGLIRTPVLYRGPYSPEVVKAHTQGTESVSGQARHLREGVVVTPCEERSSLALARVALKSVSEAYLLRKGGTEYS